VLDRVYFTVAQKVPVEDDPRVEVSLLFPERTDQQEWVTARVRVTAPEPGADLHRSRAVVPARLMIEFSLLGVQCRRRRILHYLGPSCFFGPVFQRGRRLRLVTACSRSGCIDNSSMAKSAAFFTFPVSSKRAKNEKVTKKKKKKKHPF